MDTQEGQHPHLGRGKQFRWAAPATLAGALVAGGALLSALPRGDSSPGEASLPILTTTASLSKRAVIFDERLRKVLEDSNDVLADFKTFSAAWEAVGGKEPPTLAFTLMDGAEARPAAPVVVDATIFADYKDVLESLRAVFQEGERTSRDRRLANQAGPPVERIKRPSAITAITPITRGDGPRQYAAFLVPR